MSECLLFPCFVYVLSHFYLFSVLNFNFHVDCSVEIYNPLTETGASNLTSFKIPMPEEKKEEVRGKTDDIVEDRKLGKLGMKEQPKIGQIFKASLNHSV